MQLLKRKEKEMDHEMERLAKEKIAKQEKIELLRRKLNVRFDNYASTIQLPDGEGSNGIRERGKLAEFVKWKQIYFAASYSYLF